MKNEKISCPITLGEYEKIRMEEAKQIESLKELMGDAFDLFTEEEIKALIEVLSLK